MKNTKRRPKRWVWSDGDCKPFYPCLMRISTGSGDPMLVSRERRDQISDLQHSRSVDPHTEDVALVDHHLRTHDPPTIGGTGGLWLPSTFRPYTRTLGFVTRRPCWLPSGLKSSAIRHYKLTHPPQGSSHLLFYFNTHLLERFLHLSLRSSICFLLCYSVMKFSHLLVLYLSAMAAPSALAIPLRHADHCSPDSTDIRCIGQKDDHDRTSNPHFSGVNVPRESNH